MTIFLIDDDAEEAELLAEAINTINSSIQLNYFSNGRDALEYLSANQKPDLIFLDLNIPLFSGKEILKELRLNNSSSKIPLVIYSTSISKKDIEDTQSFNVSYMQKPENFNDLCNEIKGITVKVNNLI